MTSKPVMPYYLFPLTLLMLLFVLSGECWAQTTAFTYQGKLTDSGSPANGQYDLQFKLFDTATVGTGTQQGSTVTVSNITVTNGSFTVQLDFGTCPTCFNGAARFLEIAVKPSSGSTYTTLSPRQPIASTPYAIRSVNATAADGLSVACVNCVTSSQIASVNGSVVSGTIPVASVPAGNANYIQNGTSQQAASNFNIAGNGTVGGSLSGNIVNATAQFNLGGLRILSNAGGENLFTGVGAGSANTTGSSNSFFGSGVGINNSTGSANSFFGSQAGQSNSTGIANNFFGSSAGRDNTTGNNNNFFGVQAGQSNTTGSGNSFFGYSAGLSNTTENGNTFLGTGAGFNNGLNDTNSIANDNTFVGSSAGSSNTTGSNNNFFGAQVGQSNTTGSSNSFFGALAGQNNSTGNLNSFFGVQAGQLNTTGNANSFFGNLAGHLNTTGNNNNFFGYQAGNSNTTGSYNNFFGFLAGQNNTTEHDNTFIGYGAGANNGLSDAFNLANDNTFVGSSAGLSNTTGSNNNFFGAQAGQNNTTENDNTFLGTGAGFNNGLGDSSNSATLNTFIGSAAGRNNTTGGSNTFFGVNAGVTNTTGFNNTMIGLGADVGANNLNNATAIGHNARVDVDNALVLGNPSVKVGIGTTAPAAHLHIAGASNSGGGIAVEASEGDRASLYYSPDTGAVFDSFRTSDGRRLAMLIQPSGGRVGINTFGPDQALTVNGNASKPGGGSWAVFSDARLKTVKGRFTTGLKALLQVQPIRYEYKADNALGIAANGEHIGFVAQALQTIIPEAVSRNEQGYLLVNNDPVLWTMVNAIKEQQTDIAHLERQLLRLRASLVRRVSQRRRNAKRMR